MLFGVPLRTVPARGRKLGCLSSHPVPHLWTPVYLPQRYSSCWRRWSGQRCRRPRGAGNVFPGGLNDGWGTNGLHSSTCIPSVSRDLTGPTLRTSLTLDLLGSTLGPWICRHLVSPGHPWTLQGTPPLMLRTLALLEGE